MNQTYLRTFVLTAAAVIVSGVQFSCTKASAEGTGAASATAQANLAPVEVPADGKEFKPPVCAEQLPSGAWYCDMGTVHWAQMKEGAHTCPICKMDLKKK